MQELDLDLVAVGDVVVEGRGRDARAFAHRLDGGGLITLLVEQLLGRVQDGLAALDAAALHANGFLELDHDSGRYQPANTRERNSTWSARTRSCHGPS